jgi:hypothetical protein
MDIKGYDVLAMAACDYGHVMVLNNNSTHYLVVEATTEGGADIDNNKIQIHVDTDARLVESFCYDTVADDRARYSSAREAYRAALQLMGNHVIVHTADAE